MRTLRLLPIIVLSLALAATAAAQSRGNLRSSGRVLDGDGKPVADAQVRAAKKGEAQPEVITAKTNDKGEYSLNGLAAGECIAFAVPLWVLPFLPPWPVVFAALFAAMLCTPLINGPLIAVLTSRTPDGLRAMTITAVISLNTLAAPLGFLVAGQVLEHWGVVPLFTAVVAGVTWMAIAYGAIVLRNRDVDAPIADQLAA